MQNSPAHLLSDSQLLQQHWSACSHIDITRETFIPTQDVCCAECQILLYISTLLQFIFHFHWKMSVALSILRSKKQHKTTPQQHPFFSPSKRNMSATMCFSKYAFQFSKTSIIGNPCCDLDTSET